MESGNKRGLLIVFMTVCIDLLGFAIVLPLLPRYGEYYDADKLTLGLLMSSFSAMQFVFAPIWGRVSDFVGRKPILELGLLANTVCYGLFGYVSNFPADQLLWGLSPLTWLFLTRIGAGVASATIPTAQAYIADTTDEKSRGKGMALIGAAFGIGFTFGPLIGAAALAMSANEGPSPWPGYLASGLSFFSFVFALMFLKESLKKAVPNTSGVKLQTPGFVSQLGAALTRPSVGLLLMTIFTSTFAFAQFESTLSLLTETLGVSDRQNFYVFAFIGFVLAVSQGGLVRRLLPKWGERKVAIVGTILMIAGLGAIALTPQIGSLGYLYGVLPLSVVGFSFVTPALQSKLSLLSRADDQGGVLGIGQSMSAIARILGPVAGITMMAGGRDALPYFFGMGVMMISLVLVVLQPVVAVENSAA